MLPRLNLRSTRPLTARLLRPMALPVSLQARRLVQTQVHHVRLKQVVRMSDDTPYIVTKKEHQTTGRGGALVRLELQHAITGVRKMERFKTSESVEVVHLQFIPYQYLYHEGGRIHLMNPETFEQIDMSSSSLSGGEASLALLQDGMPVNVHFLEGVGPLSISLPEQYSFQVEEVENNIKFVSKGVGQRMIITAGGNLRVRGVPDFIKVGEWITVELPEGKYLARGKLEKSV